MFLPRFLQGVSLWVLSRCWDLSAGNMKWIYQVPILAAIVVRIPWLNPPIPFRKGAGQRPRAVRLRSLRLCLQPFQPAAMQRDAGTLVPPHPDRSITSMSLPAAHPWLPLLMPGGSGAGPRSLWATEPQRGVVGR